MSANSEGLLEPLKYAFGNLDRVCDPGYVVQQYCEFVTAETRGSVTRSYSGCETLGNSAEQGIACFMTKTIIDHFEPV